MTPPPSSTSPAPPNTGMSRPPNASVTSMPSSQWMGGVTTPSMMGVGQYNMKGYAPAPWLSGQGMIDLKLKCTERWQFYEQLQCMCNYL